MNSRGRGRPAEPLGAELGAEAKGGVKEWPKSPKTLYPISIVAADDLCLCITTDVEGDGCNYPRMKKGVGRKLKGHSI